MNQETITAIKEALTPVADKIGAGAEYTWEILVQGQFAEGIALATSSFVFILTSLFIIFWNVRRASFDKYDGPNHNMVMTILGTMMFILTIAITNWVSIFVKLFSPEYAALKMLIGIVSR